MFTRPDDLRDAEVADALGTGWGLRVVGVEHAPLGFGSHHWWVRTSDGAAWFATADDLRTRRHHAGEPLEGALGRLRGALSTAACLHDRGLGWVVAPVPTSCGEVLARLGDTYALTLHRRVEGRTFGWGPYDDEAHRWAVLDRLVELHEVAACRDAVGTDTLTVPLADDLRAVLDDPGPRWDAGPFAARAWQLVGERGGAVRDLLDRHAALTEAADPERFVVTHGEPHRANTVVTDSGVVLVDWDTVLLAPPERDLWRMVGEDAAVAQSYAQGTGTTLDVGLLDAYRLGWDLADVASFVAVLRGPHTDDEDTRTAWAGLRAVLTEPDTDTHTDSDEEGRP